MKIKIKEQSFLARLAARKLGAGCVAMVIGRTVHLWNVGRDEFLQNKKWKAHEMEHVRQFQRYGFLRFCFLYLWESALKGYYNNRFEVAARQAETGNPSPDDIEFT